MTELHEPMGEKELHMLWDTELEILDVIHQVCVDNHLRYTLACGTAIGFARHGGFIPWDDDIDLLMPREDYETLLSIWDDVAPQGYLLQNYRTDSDFTQNFTKIRKDHTAFIHDEEEKSKKYHKGIFVDILPRDRVAPNRISRACQYIAAAIVLLYSREKRSGTGGIIGLTERILLALPAKWHRSVRNAAEHFVCKWNGRKDCMLFFPSSMKTIRLYYPPDLFEKMITVTFCGKEYYSVADWDLALRIEYGDYMQLPPEEERVWKHHPIILDFEHNYEELEST